VYRYAQTSLVTASTWGDPTQVAAGYIALFGSKAPSPPDRPQNFEELAQREKELTAMAGATPEGRRLAAVDHAIVDLSSHSFILIDHLTILCYGNKYRPINIAIPGNSSSTSRLEKQ